jgi:hypothetical protein
MGTPNGAQIKILLLLPSTETPSKHGTSVVFLLVCSPAVSFLAPEAPPPVPMSDYYNAPSEDDYERLNRIVVSPPSHPPSPPSSLRQSLTPVCEGT